MAAPTKKLAATADAYQKMQSASWDVNKKAAKASDSYYAKKNKDESPLLDELSKKIHGVFSKKSK